ncbi:MAG: energy transducer TonB [Hyphomicrobiales bacterium]|nr:energy transducer TonB [Hyphomicrobiales bacterium]
MRLRPQHWIVAVALSAGAHLAMFVAGETAQTSQSESSAGAPAAVWGIATTALSDSAEPKSDTTVSEETTKETVEPEKPMELAELTPPKVVQETETKPLPEPAPVEALPQVLSETALEAVPARDTSAEQEPTEIAVAALTEPETPTQTEPEMAAEVVPEDEISEERPVETLQPVKETRPKPKKKKTRKKPTKRKKKTASLGGPVGQISGNAGRSQRSTSGASVSNYSSRVLSHLRRFKRHPGGRARGTVRMVFVLGSNGSVRSVRVAGRSGNATLDNAALAMVRRASPFPSFPSGMRKSTMTFTVPVRFSP